MGSGFNSNFDFFSGLFLHLHQQPACRKEQADWLMGVLESDRETGTYQYWL